MCITLLEYYFGVVHIWQAWLSIGHRTNKWNWRSGRRITFFFCFPNFVSTPEIMLKNEKRSKKSNKKSKQQKKQTSVRTRSILKFLRVDFYGQTKIKRMNEKKNEIMCPQDTNLWHIRSKWTILNSCLTKLDLLSDVAALFTRRN